jgi:tetraacyldisaccharide 4'-kinase
MLKIKKKIEPVMRSKDRISGSPMSSTLFAMSLLYGAAQKLRAGCYQKNILQPLKLPCKVISIGNITVGGTGKTPMTVYVAQKLQQAGAGVAVISRGYKGGAEKDGGVVSDGKNLLMNSQQAGDEPYLIASRLNNLPVIVGKNRFEAGRLALSKFQPDVIVLDDGFQHLKLQRDLNIVLLDHDHPFGNGHLLPRGILREPLTALTRATACILTRSPNEPNAAASVNIEEIRAQLPKIPIFTSSHVPYTYSIKSGDQKPFEEISDFHAPDDMGPIKHKKVFGFSGIARNDDFQRTVKNLGFDPRGFLGFSDHHQYTRDDLEGIIRTAGQAGADCLITTEKDHVRIAHQKPLSMELVVVGVRIDFVSGEKDFISIIQSCLQQ